MTGRRKAIFAGCVACIGWIGLAAEADVASRLALRNRLSPALAVFIFLRFFTNLTSLGVAVLMTVNASRAARCRPLPSARLSAAMLVYILVVSMTYEILLRRLWSPRGIWFIRDAVMHDVVPILTLAFWVFCAPKSPLSWRDPLRWLAYPSVYLALVLAAGRAGFGYPYAFIDAERLGFRGVARIASAFAAVFYGVGMAVVALGKLSTRNAGRNSAALEIRRLPSH